ncbi:MAG: tetratricopeptide repeat protein [Candidatus Thorarchaeota archaeon]
MLKQFPKELARIRELMNQAKIDEALEIVENLEKIESLSPENKLSALLFKAGIYGSKNQFEKQVKFSEMAYQMSEDLGLLYESIEALIGQASIVFLGNFIKSFKYIKKAERAINSLIDGPSTKILKRKILFIKSWILPWMGNNDGAIESAMESLKLLEEEPILDKLALSGIYNSLGWRFLPNNQKDALDYAMKGLTLNKELNYKIGISQNYTLLASIYYNKQDYKLALDYCRKAISIKEIGHWPKIQVTMMLADIHYSKAEINQALKYQQQALTLSEESNSISHIVNNLFKMGYLYRAAGRNNLVITNIEKCLSLSEKQDLKILIASSITLLVLTYIDEKSVEKANYHFSRLSELYDESINKGDFDITIFYQISKAYILKASTRMRDRVEAQTIFKDLTEFIFPLENPMVRDTQIFSMSNLCDLLIEELSIYNDPKLIDEIIPIITKSLKLAEEARNYGWLANTKLLQAKLALIQMNIEEGKKLMVEAQRIATLHGFDLLAWGISSEHDKLLDQIDDWNEIQKDESPIADRIKLASTNGVLERMQGKRSVEPPELISEDPILLVIMDNSGATYFNHPFVENWDHSDLFSSFMSAFNTFSSEIFSNSIDRIKIKENTILINPVDSFLACYVIKGQSYPALQKLTRFTKAIRESSEIWQALSKSVKTSEMLELNKPPALKTVIDEIFTQKL